MPYQSRAAHNRIAVSGGDRFGRWVVTSPAGETRDGRFYVECECDCGTRAFVNTDSLRRGSSGSCGCLRIERSAERKRVNAGRTQLATIWRAMVARCTNPGDAGYANYGGRGVRVCDEWMNFETFLRDVGVRPVRGLTIERKDVNGNYEPNNVEWQSYHVQSRNKTNNRWHEFKGKRLLLVDWAAEMGIKYRTLVSRIYIYKWPIEKALMTPIKT